jgi:CRP-like cAMP-binding protein
MDDKAALAGSLSFISLPDIFQILGSNNSTGIMRITSQYMPYPGVIYFLNGDPINAATGPLKGIDAIYALFGWVEGKFEFHEEGVKVRRVVNQSKMEIVLDAMRMLDDGLIEKVGPSSFTKEAVSEGKGNGSGKKGAPQVIKGPLVDYTHVINEEEFHDGDRIVREGGYGKWVWVILKGSAEVSRETSKGPMTIARVGEGCFLGSFTALPFMEYSRSATITAVGDVLLGLLDTELLYREFTSLSPDFRLILLSLDSRLRKITSRALELFIKKDDKSKGYTKNKEVIIEKGSSIKEAFTITEGEAYVIGETRKGQIPLFALERDEAFGHMPSMDMGHEPRSAMVLASKDLKVNRLDAERLQKEYEQLSGTFKNMIYNTCTCIFVTTKLAYRLHEAK